MAGVRIPVGSARANQAPTVTIVQVLEEELCRQDVTGRAEIEAKRIQKARRAVQVPKILASSGSFRESSHLGSAVRTCRP